MAFVNGKRQREARWLRELYDEDFNDYHSGGAQQQKGFSVYRSYPIIRSNTGKPTYLQLKWAISVIKLWANGIATRRVPLYPGEAAATKQRGTYVNRNPNQAAKPKAREAKPKVDHLPQVQARDRHAPVRRNKRIRKGRASNLRSR